MSDKINTEIISEYISANNITRKAFCKQCGISTATLYRIMNGKNFYLMALFKIARTIKIPIHRFFV